jgi:hypothetical protein
MSDKWEAWVRLRIGKAQAANRLLGVSRAFFSLWHMPDEQQQINLPQYLWIS